MSPGTTMTEPTIDLAVIGGSGLYQFPGLENISRRALETPYGPASGEVVLGDFAGKRLAFLARHGESHALAPHRVNYRANLWALHALGARRVIGVNAVGGIRADMGPRVLVVPDQLIDYTHGRVTSFCDAEGVEVRHIDFSEPYTASLRQVLRRDPGPAAGNPRRNRPHETRWLRPGRHDRDAGSGPGA